MRTKRRRRERRRSKWDGVGDANAAGDRKPWFEPGLYFVEVQECKDLESRQGELLFIVEAKVLKIYDTEDSKKMRVGSVYSQIIKFNQDMGPINVKRFILAANGLDPEDEENSDECGEDEVEMVCSKEQPLAGTQLKLQCDLITTKAGNPFTKYTWFAAGSEEDDEYDEYDDDDDEYDDDEYDEEGAA